MARIPMSDRHRAVVDRYMIHRNKYLAMKECGYSEQTAVRNVDVFGRVEVQAEIEKRERELSEKHQVDADYVIGKLKAIVEADLGSVLMQEDDGRWVVDIGSMNPDHFVALTGISVDDYKEGRGPTAKDRRRIKVALADKLKALELLGKHLGLFTEKLELVGVEDIAAQLRQGRQQAFEETKHDNEHQISDGGERLLPAGDEGVVPEERPADRN